MIWKDGDLEVAKEGRRKARLCSSFDFDPERVEEEIRFVELLLFFLA